MGLKYKLAHGYYQFVAQMIFAGVKAKVVKKKVSIAIASIAVGTIVAYRYTRKTKA
jgi:hypothetical protein